MHIDQERGWWLVLLAMALLYPFAYELNETFLVLIGVALFFWGFILIIKSRIRK